MPILIALLFWNLAFAIQDLPPHVSDDICLRVLEGQNFDHFESTFERSIRLVSTAPGHFGGKFLVLERSADLPWASTYTSSPAAPQGDPRLFIHIYGARTAAFFGFRILDEAHLQIPDVDELNGAIGEYNRGLDRNDPLYIGLSFVKPRPSKTPITDYLDNFARYLSLPVDEEDSHMAHDVCYHASAISTPVETLDRTAEITRHCLTFDSFIRETADYRAPAFLAVRSELRRLNVLMIDRGTAAVSVAHHPMLNRDRRDDPEDAIVRLTREGQSPRDTVCSIVSNVERWHRLGGTEEVSLVVAAFEKNLHPEALTVWSREKIDGQAKLLSWRVCAIAKRVAYLTGDAADER